MTIKKTQKKIKIKRIKRTGGYWNPWLLLLGGMITDLKKKKKHKTEQLIQPKIL